MLPLETLPPGEPSGGVVYLRIVLSPDSITGKLYLITRIRVVLGNLPGSPTVYVTRKFITVKAAGVLDDKFVYNESKPKFTCRIVSKFYLCSKHYT